MISIRYINLHAALGFTIHCFGLQILWHTSVELSLEGPKLAGQLVLTKLFLDLLVMIFSALLCMILNLINF